MIIQYDTKPNPISLDELEAFELVPSAVASDCLDRSMAMVGAINPLHNTMRICGIAKTVECAVGDNRALRAAVKDAQPGDVIVCDAKGYTDRAVFGGLMALFANEKSIGGLVIDGAVRDSEEIIGAGLNMFCRGVVPNGPVASTGGSFGGPIECGGVKVASGDLVLGDQDGVVIVPATKIQTVLQSSLEILEKEAKLIERLKKGGTLAEYFGHIEIKKV